MSDEFDPEDFDAPRRDLDAFLSGLNKVIRNDERGYQAGLRSKAAAMLAIYKVLNKSHKAFAEMIAHKCFKDDEKIQILDKSNYRKHLAKCIVKRCFAGSDAFASTLSKFTTVLKHLVAEEVEPEECAQTIKEAGGFKSFYELAVEAKRQGKAASGGDKKGSNSKARARSGDKSTSDHTDDDQDGYNHEEREDDDGENEADSPRGVPPNASAEPLTVKYILDNYFLVRMPIKKKLDRYRNGPFSEDEELGLKIAYGGEGPEGLEDWVFVSELELEDSDVLKEDNDNDDANQEDAA